MRRAWYQVEFCVLYVPINCIFIATLTFPFDNEEGGEICLQTHSKMAEIKMET